MPLTKEQRRLLKVVIAPMLHGAMPLPTFEEWCATCDALMPPEPVTELQD